MLRRKHCTIYEMMCKDCAGILRERGYLCHPAEFAVGSAWLADQLAAPSKFGASLRLPPLDLLPPLHPLQLFLGFIITG